MSPLEDVRALTWDGRASFPMTGIYGSDSTGRWVLTREGRYQIPDDAIVLRSPAPAPAPEPKEVCAPQKPPEPDNAPSPKRASTRSKAITRRKR